MTEPTDKNRAPDDYYLAGMDDGALSIQPFCGCGNGLDEDYYCDRCRKKCRCRRIVCRDAETLEQVRRYIRKSPQFSGFQVERADVP
jgi:hypothetical protein